MTRQSKSKLKRIVAATLAATTLTMSLGTVAKAGSNVVIVQNGHLRSYVVPDGAAPRRYYSDHGTAFTRELRDMMRPVFPDIAATRAAPRYRLDLDCVVAGTPVDRPNDIRISNPHTFALEAGTIQYTAPLGNAGIVNVPVLGPGQAFYVSNAVPGGTSRGAACSASTY